MKSCLSFFQRYGTFSPQATEKHFVLKIKHHEILLSASTLLQLLNNWKKKTKCKKSVRVGWIEGSVINKQGDSLELWDRKNQTNNPDNWEDGNRQAGFNKTAVAYTELR